MAYKNTKYAANAVNTILARYGVPKKLIKDIRRSLIFDAIQESEMLKAERIYSSMALAVLNVCGEEAIVDVIREHDRIMGSINEEETSWESLMEELKDRAGIVIREGTEDERAYVEVKEDENGND